MKNSIKIDFNALFYNQNLLLNFYKNLLNQIKIQFRRFSNHIEIQNTLPIILLVILLHFDKSIFT